MHQTQDIIEKLSESFCQPIALIFSSEVIMKFFLNFSMHNNMCMHIYNTHTHMDVCM